MLDVAHAYGSITFIDEVHAVGLYGHNGAVLANVIMYFIKMDIISGTLGILFHSTKQKLVVFFCFRLKHIEKYWRLYCWQCKMTDFIRSYGSGFILTTSMPPSY
jgi:5-aminolevulinate synthase